MSTVNPYMPPRADVADVQVNQAVFEEPSILTWRGRIGRLRYLAYTMGAYLVFALVAGIVIAMSGSALGQVGVGMFLVGISFLAFFVFVFMAGIQRAHDMDWTGWTVLLLFIPFVGFIVALIFLFNGGTQTANRFGAPPTPNTWGVRVLACLLPAVFVIGMLAAIALPAYKSYTDRAKAAQMK